MVANWIQQQVRNVQSAVSRRVQPITDRIGVVMQPVTRVASTTGVIAPIFARSGVERVEKAIRPAVAIADTHARVISVIGRPVREPARTAATRVVAAGREHAAMTEAAGRDRATREQEVQDRIVARVIQEAKPLVSGARDFIESPQVQIGSRFMGAQIGRAVDVVATPVRAIIPETPSFEEHLSKHPEDMAKGALFAASIIPIASIGGAIVRGGAAAAGGAAARGGATGIIRTGGSGAGLATPTVTAIEDVMKIAGAGATLIGASRWGQPETRPAPGMEAGMPTGLPEEGVPTGIPDWMDDWVDPHGGVYGGPEIEPENPSIRGERYPGRYPGEDFGDYLRYRDELARQRGAVRRRGPIPHYEGPEIISGGRTIHAPELPIDGRTIHTPELPIDGRTIHTPELPIDDRTIHTPELFIPVDIPPLPQDITTGSTVARSPPLSRRAPGRGSIGGNLPDDTIGGYVAGRPVISPAREMPDLNSWVETLSRDVARDLDIQFGVGLSPPRPDVAPKYGLDVRIRAGDRPGDRPASTPDFSVDPLTLPDIISKTRTQVWTGAGVETGIGTGTGTTPEDANEIEFPRDYPLDYPPDYPPAYPPGSPPPRPPSHRKRDRRHDRATATRQKGRRQRNDAYGWHIMNPSHDLESVFGVGTPQTPKKQKQSRPDRPPSFAPPPDMFDIRNASQPKKRKNKRKSNGKKKEGRRYI